MNPASIDFSCLISSHFAKNCCEFESVYGFIELQFLILNTLPDFKFHQLQLVNLQFAIEFHL